MLYSLSHYGIFNRSRIAKAASASQMYMSTYMPIQHLLELYGKINPYIIILYVDEYMMTPLY